MKKILALLLSLCSFLHGVQVTTTADSGPNSLRDAINTVNSGVGGETITFNIPEIDSGFDASTGTWKITLNSSLPDIVKPNTTVDGTTQPVAPIVADIRIEISGENVVGGVAIALSTGSDGSAVKGLAINSFYQGTPSLIGTGILVTTSGNTIENNYIGTAVTGTNSTDGRPRFNGIGVYLLGSNATNNTVTNNIIGGSSFNHGAISLNNSANTNLVSNNFIGVDKSGAVVIDNTIVGIQIGAASDGNTIVSNVVSGSTFCQILFDNFGSQFSGFFFPPAVSNVIDSNKIGTNSAGNAIFVQKANGILLSTGNSNTEIKNNLISGNLHGILAVPTVVGFHDNVLIENNKVGTDMTGAFALPNARSGITLGYNRNAVVRNNLVSGNLENGLLLQGYFTDGLIVGNSIGTNATVTQVIGNGCNGIQLGNQGQFPTSDNCIGGLDDSEQNIIVGNGKNGIYVYYSSTVHNQIINNCIGTTPEVDGVIFGNGKNGIFILGSDSNILQRNHIKNNKENGIILCKGSCNTIGGLPVKDGPIANLNQNSIMNNGCYGIVANPKDNHIFKNILSGNSKGDFKKCS